MKLKKDLHVLLLKGGISSEREVSLNSAKSCYKALKENGYKVTELDFNLSTIVSKLKELKPDVCFNALHGKFGEDGNIQGLLNILKIPYTHSGVSASSIAMNKMHFKNLISSATQKSEDPIDFPNTLEIINGKNASVKSFGRPYVIKPKSGGSSVGVTIIKNKKELSLDLKQIINDNTFMAEFLVGTTELTVTVLKNKPLCVTEIKPSKNEQFYNYNSKYSKNGSLHEIPAKVPTCISKRAMGWALKAHQIIGCKGISRSDFRYDSNNRKLFMLEINTQPGLTETSLAPEQALHCNIDMKNMVRTLIEEATYEC